MKIVEEVKAFAIRYYEEKVSALLNYHSIEHTRLVAQVSGTIADAEGLNERSKDIVVVAAWFHDIGHAVSLKDHEAEGCKIARQFLSEKGMDEEFIVEVEKCIGATKIGAPKNSLLEEIIGDADFAHAGMDNFMEISNLLRKEMCNFVERKCSKRDYWKQTLDFILGIKYYTNYAKNTFEPVRLKNIRKVEKRIKKLSGNKKTSVPKSAQKSTARGIETMFRLTARNQINLSSIADNKANIMLTINAVLVSVLMSTSALTLQTSEHNFLVPGIILIIGCLISLVFAIFSVIPKYGTGNYSDEDLKKRKLNLLFFGNFFKMPYETYEKGVKEMMNDYDYLYGTLTKDQYNLGKVLAKKYKLLSYSYRVFLVSFVVAVLTFLFQYLSKYL
ncbi:Pycsar system effector family protein [Draconibacterium halophilum]|uniref:HD domain-containing protein n=1 Tax=Draconibacterium halophilum TaxID=2706887 RepID=A0A6C0RCV4_9BACT|nr:Pycsar system effector family protein [Draconibacterium halophilum]QIA06951.1 HD domain-containing protein [Draconibacterium halophilum]